MLPVCILSLCCTGTAVHQNVSNSVCSDTGYRHFFMLFYACDEVSLMICVFVQSTEILTFLKHTIIYGQQLYFVSLAPTCLTECGLHHQVNVFLKGQYLYRNVVI
jgi:hypothetical protein